LEIARALGYGNPAQIEDAEGLSNEVGKMIYSIIASTKLGAKKPTGVN
jgi:hypothetical protein